MKTARRHSGFTLIEMLVVLAIIGILVAITLPTVGNWSKGDIIVATTRQLLDDVARARQYAISQRTTVYMVFCPANFWSDARYGVLPPSEKIKAEKLFGKQLNAYNFVTLRSVGEQPGQLSPRYLQSWKVMPEGATIAGWKFNLRSVTTTISDPPLPALPTDRTFLVKGFSTTTNIPFPSADAAVLGPPYVTLPYIAFNHQGQLTQDGVTPSEEDEYLPIALGSMGYTRDANRVATNFPPSVTEKPASNSINAFMLVHIDWLTGRARVEKQELK